MCLHVVRDSHHTFVRDTRRIRATDTVPTRNHCGDGVAAEPRRDDGRIQGRTRPVAEQKHGRGTRKSKQNGTETATNKTNAKDAEKEVMAWRREV